MCSENQNSSILWRHACNKYEGFNLKISDPLQHLLSVTSWSRLLLMRKVFVLQQIPDHNSGHIFWSHEILGGEKFSLGREKLGPLVGNWDLDYLAPQLAQLTTHQRSKCRFFYEDQRNPRVEW